MLALCCYFGADMNLQDENKPSKVSKSQYWGLMCFAIYLSSAAKREENRGVKQVDVRISLCKGYIDSLL